MKQILLLVALFVLAFSVNAQYTNALDSIKIATLKQQLKKSKGQKEVDVLNELTWEYMWGSRDKTPALSYGTQAKNLAEKIQYEKGLGYATYNLGMYYRVINKQLSDSLYKTSVQIAEKLKDNRLLGWHYYGQWELKKAYEAFRKAKDIEGEAEVVAWLCDQYSKNGDEENANFSYCQRALELAPIKKNSRISYNKWLSEFSFESVAGLYNYVGDYKSAFAMLQEAEKYASSPRDLYWSYGNTYKEMGKYDSSLHFFEKALAASINKWQLLRHTAYANQRTGNHQRAIELLEESSSMFRKAEDEKRGRPPFNWRGEIHTRLAQSYDSIGNRKDAVKNYEFSLEHSRKSYQELAAIPKPGDRFYGYEADRRTTMMNVARDMSFIFHGLEQYDSAFYYLTLYTELKEDVDSKKRLRQLNMQLSNFKKSAEDQRRASQLQLLNKENELKKSQLKQEATLRNGLIIGMVLILLTGIITFRTLHLKRKNEKLRRVQLENELLLADLESKQKQTQLQQKATELEMQALRAQMNPHFIFNCLSSINRFILKNETEAASDYLTRFSRLIRMVLINSQKSMITLEDELEMLRLYLDMERLRFRHSFDYNIILSNQVDMGNIFIPPLLLQPFCENAIWHGLMHKEGQGKLDIQIQMENNGLVCTITDNGIGRKKAAEVKSKTAEKNKSLGLKITTDRLALLNQNRDIQTFYKIVDLVEEDGGAAGTKVSLQIMYNKEAMEAAL